MPPAKSAAGNEVEMETAFLPAAIVWAALCIGLACVLVRLKEPQQGPEHPQHEEPAAEAPVTGD